MAELEQSAAKLSIPLPAWRPPGAQPWTATFRLDLEPEYVIYEYACHEGNYGLRNTLSGARVSED